MRMEIIPAIDIRDGKCVRLYQGDYQQETVYSDAPVEVAIRWAAMGASRVHVADLDGARAGAPVNTGIVRQITSSVTAHVQLGGGVRTLEAASEAISLGVSRVIIGTAAVEAPGLAREMCIALGPEAVVVSVDARDGDVMVRGWTETSKIRTSELVRRLESEGIRRIVYTDVSRDGTLSEPNFPAIEALVGQTRMKVVVAGGVASVDHLRRLSQIGVEGAIVGRAIYTGDIDLGEAIDAVGGLEMSPA